MYNNKTVNNFNKMKGEPKILTIASGKGGVGKTNLAVNLALALNNLQKKCLVIDGDLGLANVNVILGIVPKYNLYNVLKGNKDLKEIILRTPYGINIIAGASGFHQLANLENNQRQKIVDDIDDLRQYDYIIIDTGAGVSDNVLYFLKLADEILIITTPEPTSITDAYGIIKSIANSMETNIDSIQLIINRVKNSEEASRVADRIISISMQFLKVKTSYMGYIMEDNLLQKSVMKQRPVVHYAPGSNSAECIDDISRRLENLPLADRKTGWQRFVSFFRSTI